jgi:thymidylate synthase
MRYPLVTIKERKMNYAFTADHALWILKGSNRLADLKHVPDLLRQTSADGITVDGAYGPRIAAQIPYVIDTLIDDTNTRRATLTIWPPQINYTRDEPKPSDDTPCTIAMDFKIRNGRLNMSVFMRSSDIWLGLPNDIFSFVMVAYSIIATIHDDYPDLEPGTLWITAASSHLYERDITPPLDAIIYPTPKPAPDALWQDHFYLMNYLDVLGSSKPGNTHRWWEK